MPPYSLEDAMGIGISIFLLTLGAILRFAIEPEVFGDVVHMDIVGNIFIIVGLVGIVLSLAMSARRRRAATRTLMHRENLPPDE